MSAFANNPWIKKDKERASGINDEPEIKKPTRAPRKITKNPFAKEEKEEDSKPIMPKPQVSKDFNLE